MAVKKKTFEKVYPIDDLIVESCITIGDVRIIPGGSGLEPWYEKIRELRARHDLDDNVKGYLEKEYRKSIKEIIGDKKKSYASVKIEAERAFDTDEALLKVDRAIDVLRLMQFEFGKHDPSYTSFAIHGSVRSQLLKSLARSDEGLSGGWERKGPLVPQIFEKESIVKMENSQEYTTLCKLIEKNNPSEMEKKTLAAITWFGSAMLEYQEHIKLSKLVTSIETLLSVQRDKDEGRIRANIGERLAFLLTESEQIDKRRGYVREWKKIYETRSRILHSGYAVVDRAMLEKTTTIAKDSIFSITSRQDIKSAKKLQEWHEDLKLR
jgi:hypothetical protein